MKAIFYRKDEGACGQYRCYQPAAAMNALGLAEARVINGSYAVDEATYLLDEADIAVFQYPATEARFNFIRAAKERGWNKIVVEMDDNVYCVSPYNELGYPGFGTKEVIHTFPDGRQAQLWTDGHNGLDIQRNILRLERFGECLKLADLVTTTVEPLAQVFRDKGAKRVVVWPNCMDFDVWKPYRPERRDEWVRVGWHGGASHYEDWYFVSKAIRSVLSRAKKSRLVLYGTVFEGTLKKFPADRIDRVPWRDVLMFPHILASLELDIGICPLLDNEFNRCKSAIKWCEYAALGLPVVASNCQPYSDVIEHGKTGFLVTGRREWKDALMALIENADLRRTIGDAALASVRERFDIVKETPKLAAAYRSLLETSRDCENPHRVSN